MRIARIVPKECALSKVRPWSDFGATADSNGIFVSNLIRGNKLLTIERLSMTFTANGKRQKSNFCCLILAVCTI